MSATIELMRLSDAKYVVRGMVAKTLKEVEDMPDDEFNNLWETKDVDCWEDFEKHELVDVTYFKAIYGDTRGWRRMEKRLSRLPIQRGPVDFTGNVHKYIVADCLGIYCDSFLSKRYFHKETWLVVCTNKQEVVNFFKRYGDKGYEWKMNDILEKWDDKTFLVISW